MFSWLIQQKTHDVIEADLILKLDGINTFIGSFVHQKL